MHRGKVDPGVSELPRGNELSRDHVNRPLVHVPNFSGEGVSGSEDRGGGDNSIQFINIGRVGDKSFKELPRKIGGWKGG